jgi:hypothetical protein
VDPRRTKPILNFITPETTCLCLEWRPWPSIIFKEDSSLLGLGQSPQSVSVCFVPHLQSVLLQAGGVHMQKGSAPPSSGCVPGLEEVEGEGGGRGSRGSELLFNPVR